MISNFILKYFDYNIYNYAIFINVYTICGYIPKLD